MAERIVVRIEPWSVDDLALLEQLMGDPVMMEYLGGPESHEKIRERQARYEALTDPRESQMYRIVVPTSGEAVGSVGYWEREWRGDVVYEVGWMVAPAFQRQGIAGAATALVVEKVRAAGKHQYLHAFPGADNPPSNAVCRRLGFTLLGACEFEYPAGHLMRCNDWRLDLSTQEQGREPQHEPES